MKTTTIVKRLNELDNDSYFCEFVCSKIIDLELQIIETLKLSEEQYNKLESIVNDIDFNNEFYCIYLGCFDVSGFTYWNIEQEENNHICITILLKKCKSINVSKLYEDIKEFKEMINDKLTDIHYDLCID